MSSIRRASSTLERVYRTFLVWGGGGHGRVVGDLVRAIGRQVVGYADSDPGKIGLVVEPIGALVLHAQGELLKVLREEGAYPSGIDASALGIGDNLLRLRCLGDLGALAVPALVHPSAVVSDTVLLGRGTVILPQAVVHVGTRIGEAVIVNSGAIVEHDCELADAVHVSPGAVICGGVTIGGCSWVGAGATVIHGVTVGENVIVGAGSTVIEDVEEGLTVVGSPAKPFGNRI